MMNLPPEIIQIIFLKLCSNRTTFPLRRDSRLLVTHVCSRWRAIALGMPTLWANLRVPIDLPPPHDHIRTWISRSAPSAFSVGFYGPLHRNTSVETFNLIVPEIQRCAYLKLLIDETTLTRLLTLPPGSLRALRSISIRYIRFGYIMSLSTILHITVFQQCPQLRRVSFEFAGPELNPTILKLPWHQLVHLNIKPCPLHEYETLCVLRQCTALQECDICTFPIRPHDAPRMAALARRPIVLPFLHTLRLGLGDPVRHSTHSVHTLRLPRLRNLRLAVASWRPRALLPLFRMLLSETVRDLDLSGWPAMDLLSALTLVPNLEALEFCNADTEVLRALGDGTILPRLVALRLVSVTPDNLLNVLEARVAVARADSNISVFANVSTLDLNASNVNMARVAALRAAGVRLAFRSQIF